MMLQYLHLDVNAKVIFEYMCESLTLLFLLLLYRSVIPTKILTNFGGNKKFKDRNSICSTIHFYCMLSSIEFITALKHDPYFIQKILTFFSDSKYQIQHRNNFFNKTYAANINLYMCWL